MIYTNTNSNSASGSSSNQPPVAEAAVSKSPGGPYFGYSNPLPVTKGQRVNLYFFADKDVNSDGKASLVPNGWAKVEWNTDLKQGSPTFRTFITSLNSAQAANIGPLPVIPYHDDPVGISSHRDRLTDCHGVDAVPVAVKVHE